jgi:diguanylate cyclase (GGDEF)-like protein
MNSDLHALRHQLQRLIAAADVAVLFQPIVDLGTGLIAGYEGLTRGPSNSFLHAPLALFEAARQTGYLEALERLVIRVMLSQFVERSLPGQLFVNVTPVTLALDDGFVSALASLLRQAGLPASRLVIEVTESHAVQTDGLAAAIAELRALGVVVAMDDLGEGFASLKRWTEIRPDFVKIDRHFVDGLSGDPLLQQFVRSIMDIARSAGCTVVAEGVESVSDLRVLQQLGVHRAQGYLIGKPVASPRGFLRPDVASLVAPAGGAAAPGRRSGREVTAGHLARRATTVSVRTSCAEVVRMMREDPLLYSLPVLDDDDRPIGVLRGMHVLGRVSERYFMDLFAHRPCERMMDRQVLVFDVHTSLNAMSDAVSQLDERLLVDGFVVTSEGRYWGTGKISDLLRAISELQLVTARYANPLTQLPGNVPIDEHIDGLLKQNAGFVVSHWDIGSFKAFNDLYGYRSGDDMIAATAEVLTRIADDTLDFVGHIGGDDFVVVFTGADWQARLERGIASFDQRRLAFVSEEHRTAGGYVAQNRQGDKVFHALPTINVGVVRVEPSEYASHRQIARAASEAKRIAKSQPGSGYFVERRAPPGGVAAASPIEAAPGPLLQPPVTTPIAACS